jgi:hypothetical protein
MKPHDTRAQPGRVTAWQNPVIIRSLVLLVVGAIIVLVALATGLPERGTPPDAHPPGVVEGH